MFCVSMHGNVPGSEIMLLSAVYKVKGEEKLKLLILDDSIPAGSVLC